MTEEKIAEEYARQFPFYKQIFAKKNFLAGLKAGRPKWHKVTDGDLPKEEKEYIVKLTDGTVDIMPVALDGDLKPYVLNISVDFYRDVEKWCEIQKE